MRLNSNFWRSLDVLTNIPFSMLDILKITCKVVVVPGRGYVKTAVNIYGSTCRWVGSCQASAATCTTLRTRTLCHTPVG
jgi:hypothetical protein